METSFSYTESLIHLIRMPFASFYQGDFLTCPEKYRSIQSEDRYQLQSIYNRLQEKFLRLVRRVRLKSVHSFPLIRTSRAPVRATN